MSGEVRSRTINSGVMSWPRVIAPQWSGCAIDLEDDMLTRSTGNIHTGASDLSKSAGMTCVPGFARKRKASVIPDQAVATHPMGVQRTRAEGQPFTTGTD